MWAQHNEAGPLSMAIILCVVACLPFIRPFSLMSSPVLQQPQRCCTASQLLFIESVTLDNEIVPPASGAPPGIRSPGRRTPGATCSHSAGVETTLRTSSSNA